MIHYLKNKYTGYKNRGFTLIELIVVMAIIAVLVLLASPRFLNKSKDAELTKHISNIKTLEDAAERYYVDHGKWPRSEDATPYSSEDLKVYADKIKDTTGRDVELNGGNYYDIDYEALNKYAKLPNERDQQNYILRNPAGKIYYMEDLTIPGKNRIDKEYVEQNKPKAVIKATANTGDLSKGFLVGETIEWGTVGSTTPNDSEIVDVEWKNKQDSYDQGTHKVGLRVKNNLGIWSDWEFVTIQVSDVLFYTDSGTTMSGMGSGYIRWIGDLSGKTIRIRSYSTYYPGGGPNYNRISFRNASNGVIREQSLVGRYNGGIADVDVTVPQGATHMYFTRTGRYWTPRGDDGYLISVSVLD